MLAQKNEYLQEASATVYKLTQEEEIRLQCEAREDYYRRMHGIQRKFEQQSAEFKALKKEKAALEKKNAALEKELTALKQSLASQTAADPPQL